MVRRFVGGQLFDVQLDGTMVPIVPLVPPRSMPMWLLKEPLIVADAVMDFLSQFSGVGVTAQGDAITVPEISAPVDVVIGGGNIPSAEPQQPLPSAPSAPEQPIEQPSGDRIATKFGLAPADLSDAIREFWPQSEWQNAAELSNLESGWRHDALNDTVSTRGPCGTKYFISSLGIFADTEFSVGYFQINVCSHGGDFATWSNARNNARKGAELYRARGNRYGDWQISAGRLGLPR